MLTQFQTKEIVIGNNLEAMYYAWLHDIPLIINSSHNYFTFDWLTPFHSRIDDYEKMYLVLSLMGQLPFGQDVKGIHFNSETDLEISLSTFPKKMRIEFEKCHIFSDENITGLPYSLEEPIYRCIDIFECQRFSKIETDLYYVTGERFPATITFQAFPEINEYKLFGAQQSLPQKSHTTSYFTQYEHDNVDDTRKLFIMKNMKRYLEKNGYKKLKFEYKDRFIVPAKMIHYDDTESIKYHYEPLEKILELVEEEYSTKFLKKSKKITLLEGLTNKIYAGQTQSTLFGQNLSKLD